MATKSKNSEMEENVSYTAVIQLMTQGIQGVVSWQQFQACEAG